MDFSYVIVGQITEGKIKKREELDQSRRVSDQWCMDAYSVSCMFTARKALRKMFVILQLLKSLHFEKERKRDKE